MCFVLAWTEKHMDPPFVFTPVEPGAQDSSLRRALRERPEKIQTVNTIYATAFRVPSTGPTQWLILSNEDLRVTRLLFVLMAHKIYS